MESGAGVAGPAFHRCLAPSQPRDVVAVEAAAVLDDPCPPYREREDNSLDKMVRFLDLEEFVKKGFSKTQTFHSFTNSVAVGLSDIVLDSVKLGDFRYKADKYFVAALASKRLVMKVLRRLDLNLHQMFVAWMASVWFEVHKVFPQACCVVCQALEKKFAHEYATNGRLDSNVDRLSDVISRIVGVRKWGCEGPAGLFRGFYCGEDVRMPASVWSIAVKLGAVAARAVAEGCDSEVEIAFGGKDCTMDNVRRGIFNPPCITQEMRDMILDFMSPDALAQGGLMSKITAAGSFGKDLLSGAIGKVSNMTAGAQAMNAVGGWVNWLKDMFGELFNFISDSIQKVTPFLVLLVFFWVCKKMFSKAKALFTADLGIPGLLRKAAQGIQGVVADVLGIFAGVWESMSEFYRKVFVEDDVIPANEAHVGGVEMYSSYALMLLAILPVRCMTGTNAFEALKLAPALVTAFRVADSGLEFLVEKMPGVFQSFFTAIGLYKPYNSFGNHSRVVAEMSAAIEAWSEMKDTVEFAQAWPAIYSKFCGTYPQLLMRNDHRGYVAHMKGVADDIQKKLDAKLKAFKRAEPVGVYLYGTSGVGKSYIARVLARILYHVENLPESELLCPVSAQDKYWSAFTDQPVIVMDDFGRGGAVTNQEMINDLLRLIGPMPFAPNVPFGNKGMFSNAEFVILTSNVPLENVWGTAEDGAFRRRFMNIKVELREEYKNDDGRFSKVRYDTMTREEQLSMNHINFVVCEEDGTRVGAVGFDRLVDIMKAARLQKIAASKDTNDDIREMVNLRMEQEQMRLYGNAQMDNGEPVEAGAAAVDVGRNAEANRAAAARRGKNPWGARPVEEEQKRRRPDVARPMKASVLSPFVRGSIPAKFVMKHHPPAQLKHGAPLFHLPIVYGSDYNLAYREVAQEPLDWKVKQVGFNFKQIVANILGMVPERLRLNVDMESISAKDAAGLAQFYAMVALNVAAWRYDAYELFYGGQYVFQHAFFYGKELASIFDEMDRGVVFCPWKPGLFTQLLTGGAFLAIKVDDKMEVNVPEVDEDGDPIDDEQGIMFERAACQQSLTWIDKLYYVPADVLRRAVAYLWNVPKRVYKSGGFADWTLVGVASTCAMFGLVAGVIYGIYRGMTALFGDDNKEIQFSTLAEKQAFWIANPDHQLTMSDPLAAEYLANVMSIAHAGVSEEYEHELAMRNLGNKMRKELWGDKGDKGGKKRFKTKFVAKSTSHHRSLHSAQAESDEQKYIQSRNVVEKISMNMVKLSWNGAGGMCGFFVRDDVLLVPYHFFRDPADHKLRADGSYFRIFEGKRMWNVAFDSRNMRASQSQMYRGTEAHDDWCLYSCGQDLRGHKNMEKYFAPVISPDITRKFECFMFMRAGAETHVESEELTEVAFERNALRYRTFSVGAVDCFIPEQFIYEPKKHGDCGSLVLGVNPGGEVEILGMHVAQRVYDGQPRRGVARPFSIGMFDFGAVTEAQGGMWEPRIELDPRLEYVKEVIHSIPFPPGKTSYVPSLLHDEPLFRCVDRAPAHLGVSKDCPFSREELIRKELLECDYGPSDPFVQEDVDTVFASISEHYYKAWEERFRGSVRVATVSEALNGGGVFEHMKPVDLKTSPGYSEEYPWVCMPGVQGKRSLVQGDAGSYELTDVAVEAFSAKEDMYLKLCNRGKPLRESVAEVVLLILKDELRTFKKLSEFRTRIVTLFDFMYTLLCRRYFMGCTNFLQGVYAATSNAVGMSVYSEDWNTMVAYLAQVSDTGFAGDYSKFERNLNEQVAEAIGHFVNRFYRKFGVATKRDDEMRMKLIFAMVNCHMVIGDKMYLQKGNLKSGCYATTILFGNLMNMFLLRLAWLNIMRDCKPQLSPMQYYEKYVRSKVYGDDNVNAVNVFVSGVYNFNSVRAYMATIGVKYTTADKSEGDAPDCESIYDLTFLSVKTNVDVVCGPPRFPGVTFLPEPVVGGRFLACGAWVTNKVGTKVGLICNLNDILRRAFGLPVGKFEELRDQLVLCLDNIGLYGKLLTWHELREAWGRSAVDVLEMDPMVLDCDFDRYEVVRCSTAEKRLMMPRGIPRGYKLGTVVVNNSIAQMDAGVARDDMQEVQDTTVTAPAKEIVSRFVGAAYGPEYSLVHLLKRFGMIFNNFGDGALRFNPAAAMLYSVPAFTGKPGWVYYFSKMFRYWSGDMKWYMRTRKVFDVYWDTSGMGVTETQSIQVISGCGPISTSNGGDVANVYQTQWASPFVSTLIPRTAAEAATDHSTPGYIGFDFPEGEETARLYMAGGDNLRFGFMIELPSIILTPPVAEEHKSFAQSGEGVQFVEENERKVDSEGARVGVVNRGEAGTIEQQFTVRQLAERAQFILSGVWSTSDPVNSALAALQVPWDFIVPGSINAIPNDNFTFYRGSVKLILKLQSQPFQLGQLIIYFVPERDMGYIDAYIGTSRGSQSILPHILVEAGKNGTYEFEVPWVHHQALLSTQDQTQLNGTVVVSVFNGLLVSPTATQQTCSYSLWAQFINPEYEVIRYRDNVAAGFERVDSVAQMGAALSVVGQAANVAGAIHEGFDFANKMGKRFVAAKALDRPFMGVNPPQITNAGAPDLSDLKQVDQGRYLGDSPDTAMLATKEGYCSPIDEMQLSNFMGRLTFYETVVFGIGNIAGDVLNSIPMTCVPEFWHGLYSFPIPMSTCALGALPFEYWRGDFVVTIQVVSAVGQVGQISVVPRYRTSSLGGLEEALSSNATIIDISTARTHRIVMPWRCVKKWLRVPHTTFTTADEFNTYAMGMLQVTALSGLGASETVPQSCYLNFSFCLENFEVFLVSDGVSAIKFRDPYVTKAEAEKVSGADNRLLSSYMKGGAKGRARK